MLNSLTALFAFRCTNKKILNTVPSHHFFPELPYAFGQGEDRMAFVANCSFPNLEASDGCMSAKPMLTDAGLCWAINSDSMAEVYQTDTNPTMKQYVEMIGVGGGEGEVFNLPGHGNDLIYQLVLFFPVFKRHAS